MGVFANFVTRVLRLGESTTKAEAPSESNTDPAPSASASSVLTDLQDQADRVREAAKWLVATLGAVAAVLVAGLQFSSIGSVPAGWRAAAAIAGAAIAILAVVALVGLLLDVLLPGEASIDLLASCDAPKELSTYITANPSALQGYATVQALATAYGNSLSATRKAMTAYYNALDAADGNEDDPLVKQAELRARAADARSSYIDGQVGYVTKLLAVEELQHTFGWWRRTVALLAAAAVGAGIGLFAWGTNPPKSSTPTTAVALRAVDLAGADLTRTNLTRADLSGSNLSNAKLVGANLTGATLTGANLNGADLDGAVVKDVMWRNTTCPDQTNSDTHKNSCDGHLK